MRRVLIVDDDDAVRLTLGALLEDAGWTVFEAACLREARGMLVHAGDLEMVVLDRSLPDGDGPTLVPEIRAARPRAAVVLLSGASDEACAGVDHALAKGGDPAHVLRVLEELRSERARTR